MVDQLAPDTSAVSLCVSLSEVTCFRVLWNEALHQSMHFALPQRVCKLIKNKLQCCLCFLKILRAFITGFSQVLEVERRFRLKMDSDDRDNFIDKH